MTSHLCCNEVCELLGNQGIQPQSVLCVCQALWLRVLQARQDLEGTAVAHHALDCAGQQLTPTHT